MEAEDLSQEFANYLAVVLQINNRALNDTELEEFQA